MESASVAADHGHHHGPPEANQSSNIDRQFLGILLFIISEIMVFGAFFASYFFVRVVVDPASWPPEPFELPKEVAGINTAILLTSSVTVHWALEAARPGNRAAIQAGL
ncbi:MAG: cytochrome c oxidase subunit 3, partial [Solirubrobacterales bacterium]